MKLIVAAAVLAILVPHPAAAQRSRSYDVRPSYRTCQDESRGITVNMLDCIGAEYDFQDGVLNARYRAVMARLTPRQRAVLRASQRRWLSNREPACIRQARSAGDGTLSTVVRNECMLYSLVGRIDWIDRYRP